MRLSTFRALCLDDKVKLLDGYPAIVTGKATEKVDGHLLTFVQLSHTITLPEDKAWVLADEVITNQPD